jgi:SSS family transporter
MSAAPVEFGLLNYSTLGAYLLSTLCLGLWFARRTRSTADYFTAGRRIPWWVMGISISNVSSISYMSIPAKAYAEDWTILWVNVPILLLAPLVIYVLLPVFGRLRSASAYEFLETRFGLVARLYGATAFVLLQLGRMALVIYLPALALAAVTDLNIVACILVIGALSAVYSTLGGIEGVIWTDFVQTVFLMGAALASFALIAFRLDGGLATIAQVAAEHGKFQLTRWSGDLANNALWAVLLGSIFTQIVPYISDQSMIQRYQTTIDLPAARHALWINAGIAIGNTCLLLGVGTAIFVYYRLNPTQLAGLPRPDAILPFFIAHELPAGVAGLVVAGVFAAAQSAISTSLNATSTVIVTDFLQRLGPSRSDASWLHAAKVITAGAGVAAVALAGVLAFAGVGSAFDFFQGLLGLTTSGLAGLFILGIFTRRATTAGAMIGAIASALVLYFVQTRMAVQVYLYALIGISTCVAVGYAASLLLPGGLRPRASATATDPAGSPTADSHQLP